MVNFQGGDICTVTATFKFTSVFPVKIEIEQLLVFEFEGSPGAIGNRKFSQKITKGSSGSTYTKH